MNSKQRRQYNRKVLRTFPVGTIVEIVDDRPAGPVPRCYAVRSHYRKSGHTIDCVGVRRGNDPARFTHPSMLRVAKRKGVL